MAKNNKRRGFTLVELIVVLVILAILAALLIPALTGYIDKAKKNQVIAETLVLRQHTRQPQALQLIAVSLMPSQAGGAPDGGGGCAVCLARQHGIAHAGVLQIHPVAAGAELACRPRYSGPRVNRPLRLTPFLKLARE